MNVAVLPNVQRTFVLRTLQRAFHHQARRMLNVRLTLYVRFRYVALLWWMSS